MLESGQLSLHSTVEDFPSAVLLIKVPSNPEAAVVLGVSTSEHVLFQVTIGEERDTVRDLLKRAVLFRVAL